MKDVAMKELKEQVNLSSFCSFQFFAADSVAYCCYFGSGPGKVRS